MFKSFECIRNRLLQYLPRRNGLSWKKFPGILCITITQQATLGEDTRKLIQETLHIGREGADLVPNVSESYHGPLWKRIDDRDYDRDSRQLFVNIVKNTRYLPFRKRKRF